MSVRHLSQYLRSAWASEEGGANIFVLLGVCFGLLLITPFFLNTVSLYATRRSSVTSADAASLAWAEKIAEYLTFDPSAPATGRSGAVWTFDRDPPCGIFQDGDSGYLPGNDLLTLAEYYKRYYAKYQGTDQFFDWARQYAIENPQSGVSKVVSHSPIMLSDSTDPTSRVFVRGVPFIALAVSLQTQRQYVAAVPSYAQDDLKVAADSTGEVFLARYKSLGSEVCYSQVVDPDTGYTWYWVRYKWNFLWQVRLKRYQGS